MDSDWLDTAEIFKMLDEARTGRSQRLSAFVRQSRLRCATPDYSSVIVVRSHKVHLVGDDYWADLDVPREADGQWRQVINFFECSEQGGTGWSKMPVPFSRRIVEVDWREGRYEFEVAYRLWRAVKRPKDLHRIMVGSASSSFEQTEAAIALTFGKLVGTVPIDPVGPRIDWVAVRAKMPRTIEDGVLGTLTRQIDDINFGTTIVALGRRIRITVSVDREGSCRAGLRRAASIVSQLDDYAARAKRYAASELLELKNNNWLTANEKPISSAEFQAEMQLSGLTFYDSGRVMFSFADGASKDRAGLFLGHGIEVDMETDDQFTYTELFG
jgi:hypothetical protein